MTADLHFAMLELHVYGPAFDLPSVDLECLAAIILLQCGYSNDQPWLLIPSSNPNVSPFGELPALKDHDGDIWVAGFRNIAKYLDERSSENRPEQLDLKRSDEALADEEAYLAFLELRGLPILDLSLYVSSDNYTNVTRSVLSNVLSWPQSWYLPQQFRDAARKRSEHLGLSGLDVDAVREKELKKSNQGISAAIPKSLQIPKKSVTSLLGSSAETARFRLEAVTADLFEPLDMLLEDHFLGDEITANILYCYVLAMLLQMNVKDFPQPWLREALHKYPRLVKWVEKHSKYHVGSTAHLPWKPASTRSWSAFGSDILNTIAESMPLQLLATPARVDTISSSELGHRDAVAKFSTKNEFYKRAEQHRLMVRELTALSAACAGLVGVLVYLGHLRISWPFRSAKPMRQGFGPAGAILGIR